MTIATRSDIARAKVEALFEPEGRKWFREQLDKGTLVAEKATPTRPCGCRTYFTQMERCPYCGKRVIRGRIEK